MKTQDSSTDKRKIPLILLVVGGIFINISAAAVMYAQGLFVSAEAAALLLFVVFFATFAAVFIIDFIFNRSNEYSKTLHLGPQYGDTKKNSGYILKQGINKSELHNYLDEIKKNIDDINNLEGVQQVSPTSAPTQQQSLFGVDNKIISDSNKNRILEAVTAGDRYKKLGEIQDNILKGYKEKLDKLNDYEPGANRENFSESMNKVSVNVHEMINKAMKVAKSFEKEIKTKKVRVPKRGLRNRSNNAAKGLAAKKQENKKPENQTPTPASSLGGNQDKKAKIKTNAAKSKTKIDPSALTGLGDIVSALINNR